MNLSYRGQRYNLHAANVPTIATGSNAQFLGQAYNIRQPLQAATRTNSTLTYRGVAH